MNVTNETSHSLHIQIQQTATGYHFTLLGRPYFMTVQTGRRPTPGVKPSREMIDNMTAWVQGRNMDVNPWAMAVSIQEKGTKLWQEGGRTDIVDPAVEDFFEDVSKHILDALGDEVIFRFKEITQK